MLTTIVSIMLADAQLLEDDNKRTSNCVGLSRFKIISRSVQYRCRTNITVTRLIFLRQILSTSREKVRVISYAMMTAFVLEMT